MTRKLFVLAAALVLNVALAGAVSSARAEARTPALKHDCCELDTEGHGQCCAHCCWFRDDCENGEICGDA